MARSEQVLVVFLASPSDVDPERNRLEEVIEELNATWSRKFGVRLELIRWETHGFPAIGQDAQDALNQQLPTDYDIFIGLMWARFGTPTGRAGSGTEEEYTRALARFRSGAGSNKIMFYFKDAPLQPSSIDPDQLAKIQSFKSSLGDEGALYWKFDSLEAFENLVRIHLSRQIQISVLPEGRESHSVVLMKPTQFERHADDLGFLDLLDLAEEYFAQNTAIVSRLGAETSDLGEKMQLRAKEIAQATEKSNGELSRDRARVFIEKSAADMNLYTTRVRTELPLFRESLRKAVDASARAILISVEIGQAEDSEAAMARLTEMATTIGHAETGIDGFKRTIGNLPRMTAAINRAKRELADVLSELIQSMAEGRTLISEASKSFEALNNRGISSR